MSGMYISKDPFPNYSWHTDTAIDLVTEDCGCYVEDDEDCGCGTISYPDGAAWSSLWTVNHKDIDPLVEAGSFYTLQAIVSNIYSESAVPSFVDFDGERIMAAAKVLGISKSEAAKRIAAGVKRQSEEKSPVVDIVTRAEAAIDAQVDEVLDTFYNYIDMAVGGELRHHSAFTAHGALPGSRESAWGCWKEIRKQEGTEALDTAVKYFRDFGGNSFGGERWATAPILLAQFERGQLGPTEQSNRRMFLDRVFTLVHNNGCMLNKLVWRNLRRDYSHTFDWRGYDINGMKYVLNIHADDNPDMDSLATVTHPPVLELWNEYKQACGKD